MILESLKVISNLSDVSVKNYSVLYNVEEDTTDAASGVASKDRAEDQGNENENEELVDDAYMDEPLADEQWIRIYNAEMEEARLADERMRRRFEEQGTDEW